MAKVENDITLKKEIWIESEEMIDVNPAGGRIFAEFHNIPLEARNRIEEAADAFLNTAEQIIKDVEMEDISAKIRYAIQHEEGSGVASILPMNDKEITIHGKEEAERFCEMLMECFR